MNLPPRRLRALAFVFAAVTLSFSGVASADPPARVARLGYVSGAVSFSPAGENDWVEAAINRPLIQGDRLWADRAARAEIQIGAAMVRMGAATAVSVLALDDRIAQLQLTQGVVHVRLRRLAPNQVFEIDTPNLAVTLRRAGQYRISVDADGNTTTLTVREGQGEVHGDGGSFLISAGQSYRFSERGVRDRQAAELPRPDEFERWAGDRDRRYDNSASARFVSPDVVGYQDLDSYGQWRVDARYGNVWAPSRVGASWAPYRDGHWAWVDPWGWTWIDDAPWGFAVSHYGRWANLNGGWAWVPAPVRSRAYYAPALVVFVGGANFQIQIASDPVQAVAWFPLAPQEIYRPAYPVSRTYFENLNRSNTVVNVNVVRNTYNNIQVNNVVYANRQVAGAVVAVPASAFVQSLPVAKEARPVRRELLASAPVAAAAPLAPTHKSVRGAAAPREQPPARVFERPVVARNAPPPTPAGLAVQQPQLDAKPGRPLDNDARKRLERAADAPAPVIKLATPSPQAARPPRDAAAERPAPPPAQEAPGSKANGRDKADPPGRAGLAPPDRPQEPPRPARSDAGPRAPPAAPPVATVRPAEPPAPTALPPAPPAAAARPAELTPEPGARQRGESRPRGQPEPRAERAAPPAPAPQAVPPQTAPPRAAVPTAPAAAPAAPAATPRKADGKRKDRDEPDPKDDKDKDKENNKGKPRP